MKSYSTQGSLKILKALSEETRYKIIEALLYEEKCACELPKLINRTQSNTSMHLAKLLDGDILAFRKEGKKVFYYITDLRVCSVFRALGYPEKNLLRSCCSLKK